MGRRPAPARETFVDTHFTKDDPSPEERQAVDSILGVPDSGWRGGARNSEQDGHAAVRGHGLGAQRHLLLPVLHAIQARMGWITPTALNYACQRLDIPPAEAYGVACFYGLFSVTPRPRRVLHVCDDIACLTQGAEELCQRIEQQLGPTRIAHPRRQSHVVPESVPGIVRARAGRADVNCRGAALRESPCTGKRGFAGYGARDVSAAVRSENRRTNSMPLFPFPRQARRTTRV